MEKLKKKRNKLLKDLAVLENDLKEAKQTLNIEDDDDDEEASSKHLTNKTNSTEFYELFTNINTITNFSHKPITETNEEKQLFQYEINAKKGNINFNLTYVSNQTPDTINDTNRFKIYEPLIKSIDLKLINNAQQFEMKTLIDYVKLNPCSMSMGIVFMCLDEYIKFYETRKYMLDDFSVVFKDFFNINLNQNNGRYLLECHGSYTSKTFFVMEWGIVFDETCIYIRNSFKIEIKVKETNFINDVSPAFKKLCNMKNTLEKEDILKVFDEIMISVKDADSRSMVL